MVERSDTTGTPSPINRNHGQIHPPGPVFRLSRPWRPLGRPDLVLPKHRCVVFVHGCFWHGHEHCPDFRLPKSRHKELAGKTDSGVGGAAVVSVLTNEGFAK